MYGDGTSAVSGRTSNATSIPGGGTNVNGAFLKIDFLNYSNTTTFKTSLGNHTEGSRLVARQVGLWRNTAAINSLTLNFIDAPNTSCAITLYGIKAA
jgi:hypothetical protein